eukprot:Clim_evm57s157 gene=Clim_evmTU57s157
MLFKKPFHVKSCTHMRNSDRKKAIRELATQCNLEESDIATVFEPKDQSQVMRITVDGGDTYTVYLQGDQPLFFRKEKGPGSDIVYPTVYACWLLPRLLPAMATHQPVFKKLQGGAHLMLPGVAHDPQDPSGFFKGMERGMPCSVVVVSNWAVLAVGTLLRGEEEIRDGGMRGKGVEILHIYGDALYQHGTQIPPPKGMTPPFPYDRTVEITDPGAGADEGDQGGEEEETTSGATEGMEKMDLNKTEATTDQADDTVNDTGDVPDYTSMSMDELIEVTFLQSCKYAIKDRDLPVLSSNFKALYMKANCPKGTSLDFKKSSWKKLGKLLEHMEKEGVVRMENVSKGVDQVAHINRMHDLIRAHRRIPETEGGGVNGEPGANMAADLNLAPQMTNRKEALLANRPNMSVELLFQPKKELLPILKTDDRKALFSAKDLKTALDDYIREEQLPDPSNKRMVRLNPHLAVLVKKNEGDVASLSRAEVSERFVDMCKAHHVLHIEGRDPVVRKGQPHTITITIEKRTGNKLMSVVTGLEQYFIEPKLFASYVQKQVAASVSVTDHEDKGAARGKEKDGTQEVLVQGDHSGTIQSALVEHFKIPLNANIIHVVDKAKKKKR